MGGKEGIQAESCPSGRSQRCPSGKARDKNDMCADFGKGSDKKDHDKFSEQQWLEKIEQSLDTFVDENLHDFTDKNALYNSEEYQEFKHGLYERMKYHLHDKKNSHGWECPKTTPFAYSGGVNCCSVELGPEGIQEESCPSGVSQRCPSGKSRDKNDMFADFGKSKKSDKKDPEMSP